MRSLNILFTCLALSLGLAACGSLGDDDDAPEEAGEGAVNIVNGVELIGRSWESNCFESELFDRSVREIYDFKVDDITKTWAVYDDAECADKIASISYHGEFQLEREGRDGYRKIDFKFNDATARVDSELGADFLSGINFCGKDNWPEDEELNLTEATVEEGCPLPDLPRTEYDLLKVEDGSLFLGNPGLSASTDAGERPTDINDDRKYEKQ